MQLRFFRIPATGDVAIEAELNQLLTQKRVLALERHFVPAGDASFWALSISYDEGGGRPQQGKRAKVDYRELLSEPEFAVFSRLRALRKELAEKEGAPPYAVFTNDQLAEMVRRRATTPAALAEIEGVGPARVERYGAAVTELVREAALPASLSEASDAAD